MQETGDPFSSRSAKLRFEEEPIVVRLDHLHGDEVRTLLAKRPPRSQDFLEQEAVRDAKINEIHIPADRTREPGSEIEPAVDRKRLVTGDGEVDVTGQLASTLKPAPCGRLTEYHRVKIAAL